MPRSLHLFLWSHSWQRRLDWLLQSTESPKESLKVSTESLKFSSLLKPAILWRHWAKYNHSQVSSMSKLRRHPGQGQDFASQQSQCLMRAFRERINLRGSTPSRREAHELTYQCWQIHCMMQPWSIVRQTCTIGFCKLERECWCRAVWMLYTRIFKRLSRARNIPSGILGQDTRNSIGIRGHRYHWMSSILRILGIQW